MRNLSARGGVSCRGSDNASRLVPLPKTMPSALPEQKSKYWTFPAIEEHVMGLSTKLPFHFSLLFLFFLFFFLHPIASGNSPSSKANTTTTTKSCVGKADVSVVEVLEAVGWLLVCVRVCR